MKIILLSTFLFILNVNAIAGIYNMNKNCEKAYDHILSLRLTMAEEMLQAERISNPDNIIIDYLENYADFLKVIISEDRGLYEKFSSEKQQKLVQFESGDKQSPWHLYAQAQFHLQHSFASLRFEEYKSAAIDINKFYRLLNRNIALFPNFLPNQTAMGLMHVLIGSIPQNYQWITRLLYMQGTVDQGIDYMQRVLSHPDLDKNFSFLKAETLFLLTFTTFNLSQVSEEINFIENYLNNAGTQALIAKHPLLIYAKAVFLMHNGKNNEAIETLKLAPVSKEYYPFYYLQYLTGQAKLNRLDEDARIWFLRYINNFRGKSFIKSAYQRLAWISLLEGDMNGYNEYMYRLRHKGNIIIDGDRYAQKEAESKLIPNPLLLKSRLLFDGGYYAEAEKLLASITVISISNDYEKTEYHYRKARIYHNWGKTDKANKEYQQTILLGEKQKWFFAANAALHLGYIYENEGNLNQARQYFKKCLSMNYDEYRTSISQKARAGLSRIGK
ncbi:MAG: hypothetical protein K0B15_02305 [Lentimicrobium sp.]|nr:hypothetical protein [Lentimicrobium sp.]